MINKKMASELNTQLNKEFYSSYLYLGMSTWCANTGYNGSASWFMLQHEEERMHAFKIYNYMLNQGAKIELLTIEQPDINYTSLLECFKDSLKHEQMMTHSFNELCDLAIKQKDHASYGYLQWFVQEQIEEEASVGEIISKLKLVGDGNGIFMIDSQLSQRKPDTQVGA
ncbi:ferritin [Candidatus Sulfurimonas baltica]|uniref:Ferritin n=1 Tax=Candidatus Sulfurimonas baltica TaxID=2740404 RepID=A0A7S7LXN7_9BACT|nr:ferritin [Candidatus Sulfurimonas baltica]QOY53326.1 ferritin [Candidatus Sulfurimonas baltica]